jgi:ABC-type Fe3+-hydroxamate transport system substrate-binding protein
MYVNEKNQLLKKPERIVSLVPSQSELLYDLGLEKEVIGITRFCIHPPHWKKEKKIIGGTKDVRIERVDALNPDLIIANHEENQKEQIEQLSEKYPVWLTDVYDLDSSLQMIHDIGRITQKETEAKNICAQIFQNFDALAKIESKPKSAVYLIWKDPWMTVGNDTFIHDMMTRAGLINVFQERNRYPVVEIEAITSLQPSLILLSSEPYPFKEKHFHLFQEMLPQSKVMLVDGELFSWYGSHLIKTPEYLRQWRLG